MAWFSHIEHNLAVATAVEAGMRKVILMMHMSLDGFIAGPNGELDWTAADGAVDDDLPELLSEADTALVGRVLYQGFAGYWPAYDISDASKSRGEIAFANWINVAPKLVFSTTLETVAWQNARVVRVTNRADIAAEVAQLKARPGKNLALFGGVGMAQTFAQLGLIDEYRLLIQPKVLGSGRPLFTDIKDRINLKLVSARTHNTIGAVAVHYQCTAASA
jgi:dihydrofolate reductase